MLEVGVGLVGDRLEHDPARLDERADVVDVAVGVVVLDEAEPEPDDALDAELRAQLRLDLLAPSSGLRCSWNRHCSVVISVPVAVDGDRAALEDQVRGVAAVLAQQLQHARREPRVVVVRAELLAPAVEAELHAGAPALAVGQEDRAGVARPGVVERQLDDLDPFAAEPPRLRRLARVGDHQHRLERGDRVGDRGVLGLGRRASAPATSSRAPAST